MTLELRKVETDAINALWQMWSTNQQFELEAVVKNVGLTGFLDVSSRLRAVGLTEEAQQPVLNICMPNKLRFTIAGTGPIQSYCQHGNITKVPYSVTVKERVQNTDQIDLTDYDARIKLRREVPLSITNSRVVEIVSKWTRLPKHFRLLNRYSYKGPVNSGFHFDLSMVRESQKDSYGNFVGKETLSMEDMLKRPVSYEVECELNREYGSESLNSYMSIIKGLGLMLQGIQRSFVLVRKSIAKNIIVFMAAAIGTRIGNFPGPLPSTLELANISIDKDPSAENIRFGDYNVTDKADGLRCLLIVANTGKIYLMDSGKNIYGTGLYVNDSTLIGTVLDGEWVRTSKNNETVSMYYAFDIFTLGQNKVFDLPFLISETDKHRLAALKMGVDKISTTAQNHRDIPQAHSLKVLMKQFYSLPGSIFDNAKVCLENAKSNDYYVDGLIFSPNNKSLPINGKGWSSQFKWKPSHDNTIDFLVTSEKDDAGADKITPEFNAVEKTYVNHKTLRLFVGGNQDPAFRDPRDTILYNKPLPEKVDDDTYRPVEFKPAMPTDPEASICNIAIDNSGTNSIYCTRTKDVITDNCIVEMAYRPENPATWRWEPIRVRWDKTERFQRGEIARTMNADWVADSVWSSIHNPISEHMIRTGILGDSAVEKLPVYYQKKSVERNNHAIRGHNKFHNEHIKSDILLKSVLKKGDALLDLSCGRGGDILKWIKNDVSWVLGTDINLDCLNAPKTGAYGRYLDLLVKDAKLPVMVFVQADSSKNIKDGVAGMTPLDKNLLQTLYGQSTVNDVPPFVGALRGMATKKFDTVTSMFSLHYYFKDKQSVDGFLTNVADNLKVGGYFAGCCFDGDTVFKNLQRTSEGGSINGKDGNQNIWAIRKSYEQSTSGILEPTDKGLGKAIDVFFMSIGEEHREYLVSWAYLVSRMNEIGCELLQPNEIAAMGLKSSSEMFSDSYKHTGSKYIMGSALQQFSFMNRWFVFRRRHESGVKEAHVDDNMVVDQDLVQEQAQEQKQVSVNPFISKTNPFVQHGGETEAVTASIQAPVVSKMDLPKEEITEGIVEMKKTTGPRPLYKFYHGSVLKDDIGMGLKHWARYISTFTYCNLKDRDDDKIVYPSLEAAFASERYKQSTDRPELGSSLFGFTESLHQKYEKLRKSNKSMTDKELYRLIEEEGAEVRDLLKSSKMKQLGAKWDETKWNSVRDDVMTYYIQERYETDTEFKLILDKLKSMNAILVYYNGTRPSDMGGLIRDDGTVDGQNKLGNLYMSIAGIEN